MGPQDAMGAREMWFARGHAHKFEQAVALETILLLAKSGLEMQWHFHNSSPLHLL